MDITLTLVGTKANVQSALDDVKQISGVESVDATEITESPNILGRKPQNQLELIEAIVSIGISLLSSAAYDGIKASIIKACSDRKVGTKDEAEDDK